MKRKITELLCQQKFVVKIADLGFSKQLSNLDQIMETYCGTPLSMSPEIMQGRKYSYKADIWSVGVIFFTLITGVFPFFAKDKKRLQAEVEKG